MFWQDALERISSLRTGTALQRRRQYPDLFSEQELQSIKQKASMATPSELDLNLEVHYKMLGERLSPFAKSGFEFAETRLYQPGDNIRFINWRRYANSGALYVNTFHEERRPQCWLIMDRRTNMRFGTRLQLKIKQAALFSLYYLFKAQQQKIAIGGIVLDRSMSWYTPHSESYSILPLLQHINAACPPGSEPDEASLSMALRSFEVRLSAGCLIIINSDFSELSKADQSSLTALSAKHTVLANHIIDPAEIRLPENGAYQIYNPLTEQSVQFGSSNVASRNAANQQLTQKLDDIEMLIRQSGCLYQRVLSDRDYLDDSQSAVIPEGQ